MRTAREVLQSIDQAEECAREWPVAAVRCAREGMSSPEFVNVAWFLYQGYSWRSFHNEFAPPKVARAKRRRQNRAARSARRVNRK